MWIPRKISLFAQLCLIIVAPDLICSRKESNQQMLVAATNTQNRTPYYFFYQRPEYPRDCHEALSRCSSSTSSSGVYVIKPDGYPEPFEVFCDNSPDDGGWTVIQRRLDGAISFNRSWEDYRVGFGFPSSEWWIGNDRLSFITNQKRYQLRIDVTTSGDSSFYVTYDAFRISDVFSYYTLVTTESQSGTIDNFIEWCPTNTVYDECKCEGTCADPDRCVNSCTESHLCVCPQDLGYLMNGSECIRREQCGCYINNTDGHQGVLLPEGQVYVSPTCDRKCSCEDGQLTCDDGYVCDSNAVCAQRNGQFQCYCDPGFTGDGVLCKSESSNSDCTQLYESGERTNGIYQIKPTDWTGSPFDVYCNMSDGGGWTVFQRRVDGSQDFYLYWDDYKTGFGDLSQNFWLGNDKIHTLTNQGRYELRIDFVNRYGSPYYAKYESFRISDEEDNYRLNVGNYTAGDAGDSLTYHDDRPFTTRDEDNDDYHNNDYSSGVNNLARYYDGAWWYRDDYYDYSILNSPYGSYYFYWYSLPGYYYIQYTEMKLRFIDEES